MVNRISGKCCSVQQTLWQNTKCRYNRRNLEEDVKGLNSRIRTVTTEKVKLESPIATEQTKPHQQGHNPVISSTDAVSENWATLHAICDGNSSDDWPNPEIWHWNCESGLDQKDSNWAYPMYWWNNRRVQ